MKLRRELLILSCLTLFFHCVSQTSAQMPPNLEISKAKFVYDVNSKLNIYAGNSTSSQRAPFTTDIVQEISALFRNVGNKTIEEVKWEFVIYKDAEYRKVDHVYTVKNKETILPNETVKLRKLGRFFEYSQYLKANVLFIEYADGTIWEGVKTKDK